MADSPILNLMLGRARGGLEQAALDYAEALAAAGRPALTVVAPDSWADTELARRTLPYTTLGQRGPWDIAAAWKLRRLAARHRAPALICHGNRALALAQLARTRGRIVAVAHNEKTKRFRRTHAVLAITLAARAALTAQGIPAHRIHHLPNMVRLAPPMTRDGQRQPPVIGSMGRFVPKKGFEILIEALRLLKQEGVAFQASLGGGGPEEHALRQRLVLAELESTLTLPGWIGDKHAWFQSLDLFVLPSHHEPFGIVLIEAMAEGLPVIATASDGPREILRDGVDGMLVPVGDARAMADALKALLADAAAARAMGERGYQRVADAYSLSAMSHRLTTALDAILTGN